MTVDAEGNLSIPEITGLDEKAKVTWNVVFSPELYDISKNSENAGNLTVKVKDRDTDTKAAYEDLVEVSVKNPDGIK